MFGLSPSVDPMSIPASSVIQFQPLTRKENMSHFTEIKTQIKDIEALRLAVKELGLTLLQNTEARGLLREQNQRQLRHQAERPV